MKLKIIITKIFVFILIIPIMFIFTACDFSFGSSNKSNNKTNNNANYTNTTNNKYVEVYIDGELSQKVQVNSNNKITIPQKPTDITTNPNSEKYFYGWFIDSNYQTPYSNDCTFPNGGKIYGKWITVNTKDFEYTVRNGEATINSFYKYNNSPIVVVPSYINSFPVVSISNKAFNDRTQIRKVIICNGIKYVSGFKGCNSLTEIELPNSVTTIGYEAFSGCTCLTSIKLPNSLEVLSYRAFAFTNISGTLTLSKNIKEVHAGVFYGTKVTKCYLEDPYAWKSYYWVDGGWYSDGWYHNAHWENSEISEYRELGKKFFESGLDEYYIKK